jgi:hypothetical protein
MRLESLSASDAPKQLVNVPESLNNEAFISGNNGTFVPHFNPIARCKLSPVPASAHHYADCYTLVREVT